MQTPCFLRNSAYDSCDSRIFLTFLHTNSNVKQIFFKSIQVVCSPSHIFYLFDVLRFEFKAIFVVISKIKNLDVTLKKTSSTIPRTPNCSAYTSAKIINGLFGFRQYCFQQFQIIIAYETLSLIHI